MDLVEDFDIEKVQTEGSNVVLKSKEIVSVDPDSADQAVNNIHEACEPHFEDGSHNLLIHLGVNAGICEINLEKQAKNVKNFCIPDSQGNIYRDQKIDEDCDLRDLLHCKIDIDSICTNLKESDHSCSHSKDAGEYLCNYIYYCSLKKFNECENVNSIFIHVPQFSSLEKSKQLDCIYDFIKNWINQR
ncbi:unnamed protein product [Moneuplotes crassus]|uniref:Uncharacterized protein n=1 Tax=Euplotes crassus TaxID=5936 RepID=A0AAD1XY32_EUPCR|nr:unnamed protein product [Moneuplotes crassus]